MLTPDQFDEIRRYTSPHSLLVIGPRGLRRIFTPFKVTSRNESGEFKKGMVAEVSRVALGTKGQLLFDVGGQLYLHSQFNIS